MDALLVGVLVYTLTSSLVWAASDAVTSSDVHGVPLWQVLAGIATAGMVLGLGRLLNSGEKLTVRLIVGRAIVSAGLAMGAGAILALIPDLSLLGICGLAALFSTLGEQFIERFLQARMGGGSNGGG